MYQTPPVDAFPEKLLPATGEPGADVVLRAGMVFTIEPGVYVPGVGGVRIEDDILVTDTGYEVLTEGPRGLSLQD